METPVKPHCVHCGRRLYVRWPGLGKLVEEIGELLQVVGKLMARPSGGHWDENRAGPLVSRLENELGDVTAATEWFVTRNRDALDVPEIRIRAKVKLQRFSEWDRETGMVGIAVTGDGAAFSVPLDDWDLP